MNCTRCRHQGRTTPITHLDTRGRKWCRECEYDVNYFAKSAVDYRANRHFFEALSRSEYRTFAFPVSDRRAS
jgi:hypothetical protein